MRTDLRYIFVSASALALLASAPSGCSSEPTPTFTRDAGTGGSASGSGGSASGSGGSASGSGGSASGSGGSASGSGGSGGSASGSGGSGGSASGSGGSGGSTDDGGVDAAGGTGGVVLPTINLPMAVTDLYNNQGWFGDPTIMAYFAAGLIKQAAVTTGPCATRVANAKGNCLEIIYTPPTGITKPDGGGATWVGVFFLTSLATGAPNWGTEPGKNLAPGAQRISFQASSPTAGTMVNFKAGIQGDSFSIAEQTQTLTTSWAPYSLPLGGQTYGPVLGAFAWILTDTTKAATFYLDSIVWE